MGVDVEIYIKAKAGVQTLNVHTHGLGDITSVGEPSKATHRISSLTRWYGVGYERGPWPKICACLMELIADEEIEIVWYLSDHSEVYEDGLGEPTSIDDILALSRHYMLNGDRPYRRHFQPASNKEGV